MKFYILFCLSSILLPIFGKSLDDEISVHSEAAIGKFLHILYGNVLFIKHKDAVMFRTDLRNLFPENSNKSQATIRVSKHEFRSIKIFRLLRLGLTPPYAMRTLLLVQIAMNSKTLLWSEKKI